MISHNVGASPLQAMMPTFLLSSWNALSIVLLTIELQAGRLMGGHLLSIQQNHLMKSQLPKKNPEFT